MNAEKVRQKWAEGFDTPPPSRLTIYRIRNKFYETGSICYAPKIGRPVSVRKQKRNVMAHVQKPDFVFQRNGRVHLYRRGCQFSRLLAAEVCASAVVMVDRPCPIQCTTAGYPLHSPFSPSLLHPCVSVCHHIPFLLYHPGKLNVSQAVTKSTQKSK